MKHLFRNIIQEWWNRPLPKIIQRDINLYDHLFIKSPVNKVLTVTGFRRTGKTFLLLDLASKLGQRNCVYINFEDERILLETSSLTILSEVLEELSPNQNLTILLDEIQNIPNWGKWVRRMNETKNYKIVLTGSSSRLSSYEIPTELRGRSLTAHLHPLNFTEFIRFKGVDFHTFSKDGLLRLLREFLEFGGLPEVALSDEGKKYLLLDEYFQTFVKRDVLERYKMRSEEEFTVFLNLILNSTEYTIGKIANSMRSLGYKASKPTISRYISYLEKSFFLNSLYLHTASIKNRMQAGRKCYFVDSFFVTRASGLFSQNIGRLMEHKVYEKLSCEARSENLFYWRNQQKYEVDFVVRKGDRVNKLIQVSYVTEGVPAKDREIRNLILAARDLNCTNLMLITWDKTGEIYEKDMIVKLIPLGDYLLDFYL